MVTKRIYNLMTDEITLENLKDLIDHNSTLVLESDKDKGSNNIKEYEEITKRILNDIKGVPNKVKGETGTNWHFVLTFGSAIPAFYPILESLIRNSGQSFDFDMKSTVVYLTICALAIALKKPKELYKSIFEELRLRGAYKYLKPTVALMNVLKKIFKVISKKAGKVITGIVDMFAYTALYAPFAIVIQDLIAMNSVTLDGFIQAFTGDWMGKLISMSLSIGTITVKHFFIDLINNLKSFKSKGIDAIKRVIDKLRNFSLSQFLFGKKSKTSVNNDIKKFTDFEGDEIINENKYKDLEEKWGSLGSYVENIKKEINEDDQLEFLRVVGKYLESKPDIRLGNAVDLLNEFDRRRLVNELQNDFLTENHTSITTKEFLSDIEDISLSGKGGFNSFIKVINALNLPEIEPDVDNCPKDFALIFSMESLNKERLLSIMGRFKSLKPAVRIINNIEENIIGLYFGLKYESKRFWVEYGLLADDKRYIIGEFKFGSPQYKKMMKKENRSLKQFQKEMENVDLKDLKTLMKVKDDFTNFSPGYFHRKSNAIIKDNVLIQGYYGIGKWDSGVLNKESYTKLKDEFKEWVLSHKWKEDVLINIKPGKFWVYFKIKLKGNNEDI